MRLSLRSNKIKSVNVNVSEVNVLLAKHVSNNIRKTMFSLRDTIEIVSDQ